MKGLRGLFRLGALALVALTLMVALTLPSAASSHQACNSSQMLDEVEIVSVEAKPFSVHWRPQDLVKFKYNGDIENGLLEVQFKDIATPFNFDGYIIEAVPGDDDPGDSKALGVPDYTSELIARPAMIGDTVTEILNLEPGTKYYVTVHAVNHNTVRISPKQRAQDSAQSSATTLLSAPFLGALEWALVVGTTDANGLFTPTRNSSSPSLFTTCNTSSATCQSVWWQVSLADDDFKGTHFALYDVANEAGQHYFRWLNPYDFGPFDHLDHRSIFERREWFGRDVEADKGQPPYFGGEDHQQADMLSLDKDGHVEDHCDDETFLAGDCGTTHYQFKAVDDNNKTVASELVEINHDVSGNYWENFDEDYYYYQAVFTAEEGPLTLSVSLGRLVDGKYKAMSDTASVEFEAPGDLRALDQTYAEYWEVLLDIHKAYDENDDLVRWLGEDGSGSGRSIWNPAPAEAFSDIAHPDSVVLDYDVMLAHLNNQLK